MEYRRGRADGASRPGPSTVTGDMLIDNVLSDDGVAVNSVVFQPGAHTHWHSHSQGQLFIIHSGRGMIATRSGQAQVVQAGDVVYAPAGEEHWHGASPDSFLSYVAVSLGSTDWDEAVPSDQYTQHWP